MHITRTALILVAFVLLAADAAPTLAQSVDELSLTSSERRQFAIHDVDDRFIRGMADAGYDDLDPETLVSMRIHGVSPRYVEDLRTAGIVRPDADQLISMRIHGVRADYVRKIHGLGFPDARADDLISFRIHGVSPEFVKEIRDEGIDLSADRAVSFRIHGVTPTFVREMKAEGFANISANHLVAFRIHGVDSDFLREMDEDFGFDELEAEDAIRLRIFDIEADYRDAMADFGLSNFTVDRLVAMKIIDVDRRLVEFLRSDEGRSMSYSEVMEHHVRRWDDEDWMRRHDRDMLHALESVIEDLQVNR